VGTSIEDVARRAGVSIATVSRSLRGLPDVAPRTRERVIAAARELDYVASPYAARLASGRTDAVGVVVPHVTRWFFAQAIAGAEQVLREGGYDLLLYNLGDQAGRERFFGRMPIRKRVDCVLVLCLPLTDAEIGSLRSLHAPVAVIGATVPGFASVRIDDVAGARTAVEHLVGLGHRRVALICGLADEPMHFTAPVDRRRGYRQALEAAGVPVDPALDVPGDFTVAGGRAAMERLLALDDPPTAVFAESDEMAFGALRALRAAGRVPGRDVSVVGFDGHETAELLDLTTVAQPVGQQGELAARALLRALAPKAQPPAAEVVPTRLVVRGSTGPPPA
jgi:DNA-binding LacI/PurR family transcriptional regulator